MIHTFSIRTVVIFSACFHAFLSCQAGEGVGFNGPVAEAPKPVTTILPAPHNVPACHMTQDRNALLPAWAAQFVPSRQIYVSPNGSDFNNGTSTLTPLKSTAAAFARAKPGTRINFAAGSYGCGVSLANIHGGTSAPVEIYSSSGAGKAQFNCNGGPSFLIDTVQGLIVEGIEIYNANDHGFHIQTTNPVVDGSNLSSDIVVHNTIIHDVALAGIKNSQSVRFYAIGDTFYNTPGGMMVESVAASAVTLSNNEGYNGQAFDEIKGGAQGGVIYRNCVHDASSGIIAGGDATGTQFLIDPSVTYEVENLQIWDNVIANTPGFAFRIVGCQSCTIANNSFWTSSPVAVLRIQPDNFVNPDGSTIPVYNGNLTIVNNLFGADTNSMDMITGDTTDQGVGSQGFNFVMNHNAWWWGTGGVPWSDINFLGDSTSLYSVNPDVMSTPYDLVPTSSSPLLHKGMPIPFVTSDAEGITFGNPPAIGAY
jgi:hypothetical protein